jgi:hypothetical protein
MSKAALKSLLTASALRSDDRRTSWSRQIAAGSTFITIVLLVLYLWQRGAIG